MQKNELEAFLGRGAEIVAQDLIGCTLIYTKNGVPAGGRIVETEAYTAADPASHSFRGRTVRNEAMYDAPGTLYLYFIYGLHYCLNIVTGEADGQAVLLRAIEPTEGIQTMRLRRRQISLRTVANGPAKLVQALAVGPEVNRRHLIDAGFTLTKPTIKTVVVAGSRVGITKAVGTAWNYRLAGSIFTSH